uniref:Lysine-rich nucleolar protein 1 n=1 Tax=Fundulus heteroclitus TaxID=8078 RepID=A0A3Q2P6M1_FUNHE
MEEENTEERVIKKENKHKKGKIFSPVQNCSAENGTQVKLKKEKKWKVDKTVAKEQEDEVNQKEEKKRKKHDSIFITDIEDNKRKKKKVLEYVNQAENSTLQDEKLEKTKKKKKLKDKSVQIQPENVKKEEDEEMPIGNNNPPKKPKKQKGTVLVSSPAETEEIVGEKTKKKKKTLVITDVVGKIKTEKKAKVVENLMDVEKEETEVKEVKLKKKKESKSERLGKDLKETETQRKKKRMVEDEEILHKKKEKFIKEETGIEEGKSKKKKNKKAKEENGIVDTEEVVSKKKKKVKVEEDEEEVWSPERSIPLAADSQNKKSKKNRMSEKGDLDNNTEAQAGSKKKRKVKEEQGDAQEVPQGDVLFLSAKNGNTDEASINQERRKALQMEIDKASQPQKPDKPTTLGQWSTAQFDNSQQQQKFLRLMGGFKKDSQVAEKTAGGANMALGKDAQQQLQQGLLGEFERAQMRKMDFSNRGAGLGFTAPSNKKFTIDVNASRSVRFDD